MLLDERGVETVEYAILAGLVVSGVVAIVFALGSWAFARLRFVARMVNGTHF
jgi:Flp pilus assembly pilin Flp